MKHLVLIDGHHMMYRAYWAIPRTLKTSNGEQVNTVFGMASMLISILTKEEPDALVVCFDEGDETVRHQELEDYKEGRAETPDDFYVQIPRIFECIDTFGFKRVSDPQYEADDFLASYAKAGEKEGMKVTIVTGDRDMFQMASDNIIIAIPHKGYQAAEYLDPKGVEAKLGVKPSQIAAYKGLCGDSSDNLPGVHGIGPKTAASLISEYGTLQGVYDHLSSIRPAIKEKLNKDREQAFFCERMAILHDKLQLPISISDAAVSELPVEAVFKFFREMEFSLLTKRFSALISGKFGESFSQEEVRLAKETVEDTQKPVKKNQLALF